MELALALALADTAEPPLEPPVVLEDPMPPFAVEDICPLVIEAPVEEAAPDPLVATEDSVTCAGTAGPVE